MLAGLVRLPSAPTACCESACFFCVQ
ncbi:hypothetical protein F2P47_07510 [Parvibaculum sedimenti]|uniref:Uncharacterized protein n=1 Tax=Parvibaculum sedimenti TaxID=2608632 RepID=A0A6N6VKV1_9HYPH|nr:hypothetical protein F2P47_07510 [Parvibaculum sedimenti]